jgi:acyl-CoA hydrolase
LIVHNCSCTMVFVAIDDEGKKRVLSKSWKNKMNLIVSQKNSKRI